jgi:AraC-like DNA-binding protein
MSRLSIFDDASVPRSTIMEVELAAPWCISVPAADMSYCYVVRAGRCCLLTEASPVPLELGSGDVVSMVAGQAHLWRDNPQTSQRPTLRSFAAARNLLQKQSSPPAPGRETAATRLLVMSAPRNSNRFAAVYPGLVAIRTAETGPHEFLDRVIELIELESSEQRPGQDAVLRRLTELVVIELVRFALPRLPPGHASWLAGLADPQIARAIAAMHRQPGRQWTLQGLARLVGMSRTSFADRFRCLTGEPPHQHLRRLRLHAAAEDLKRGERSLARIAVEVGYRSESAFNKAFTREVGMPPARYRRLHQST